MSQSLFIYTTPANAAVALLLDDGRQIQGSGPMAANGRQDAHQLLVPDDAVSQGCVLMVTAADYAAFSNRGLYDDAAGRFVLDDVRLVPIAVAPVPPDPGPVPPATDPLGIINEVYATGRYNLATHTGCGEFTEACCVELHRRLSPLWGHIRKEPGQNQYQGHAVDALMLLAGEGNGIWDIIYNSESSSAAPAYNYKEPPNPDLWYYPVPDTDFLLRASGARGGRRGKAHL